jgi:alanyl-tRNA synthetase
MEKKKFFHNKKGGEAHVSKEWDSDESSSSDFDDEDIATLAINKGILFSIVDHKCLMAKESKNKVYQRSSPKYTTSDDESNDESSDEEDTSAFKGLSRDKIDKINELIKSNNEKDELLESQEGLLVVEHAKFYQIGEGPTS